MHVAAVALALFPLVFLVKGAHEITLFSAESGPSLSNVTFNFTFTDTLTDYPLSTKCGATWKRSDPAPTVSVSDEEHPFGLLH
jgi:hypothetical protein